MVKHDIEPFVAVKKGDEYWKYTSPVGFEAGGAGTDATDVCCGLWHA